MSPICGNLTDTHESVFVGYVRQERIGTEPRQGLAEAGAGFGCEIAGAEVFRWTVESIAGLGKVKVLAPWGVGELDRLLSSTDAPEPIRRRWNNGYREIPYGDR